MVTFILVFCGCALIFMLIHGLVVADSGSASTDDPVADSHIADLAAICEASGVPVGRR